MNLTYYTLPGWLSVYREFKRQRICRPYLNGKGAQVHGNRNNLIIQLTQKVQKWTDKMVQCVKGLAIQTWQPEFDSPLTHTKEELKGEN